MRSWWTLFVVAIVLLLLCMSNGLGIAVFRGGVDQRRRFQSNKTILRACSLLVYILVEVNETMQVLIDFSRDVGLSVVRVSSRDV